MPVRTSTRRRSALLAALSFAAAVPAGAVLPRGDDHLAAGSAALLQPLRPIARPAVLASAEQAAAIDALGQAWGGRWRARFDDHGGRPVRIWGGGAAWMPGRGNALAPDAAGLPGAQVMDLLEARARAAVAAGPQVFRVPPGITLVRDDWSSKVLAGGRLAYVTLRFQKDGVPVEGDAFIAFHVSHGNLVQVEVGGLADSLASARTVPSLDAAAAFSAVQAQVARLLGLDPGAALPIRDVVDGGTLVLLPWRGGDEDLRYRLAWRFAFHTKLGPETWVSHRDAVTGEQLSLFDDTRYACTPPPVPQGRVTGGVFTGAIQSGDDTFAPESQRPMPHAVVQNGGTVVTDVNGLYPLTVGESASTSLSGRYFDVTCAGCADPPRAFATSAASGFLDLGTGGLDTAGNGLSTRPERNCYYHLSAVRQLGTKHLDDAAVNGFFSRVMPASVNDVWDTCNAGWDGNGVSFLRSSGACNNTGEIAEVMQHEWGHGLDQFTGRAGDGARGEGLSDVVAFLATHDPRLGRYFFRNNPNGIRNADEAAEQTRTTANVDSLCPGGSGPLGREVHCEGRIFAQAFWHLGVNLRASHGELGGWHLLERLFFQSLGPSTTYLPDLPGSTYDAVVAADDDDGNLGNGTPNGDAINEAFAHHGMAPADPADRVGDSPDCVPPPAASFTLTTRGNAQTGQWQVEIAWADVPGASEYRVYRNDLEGQGALLPVGALFPPATTLLDDNVEDGVDYTYTVVVLDGTGCVSVAPVQAVAVGEMAELGVRSFTVDDAAGNFNGVSEPGETVTLALDVVNTSTLAATSVVGTLTTSHPGVTILTDTAAFGDVAAGASRPSQSPHFVLRFARGVSCGESVPLVVSLDAAEGCAASTIVLALGKIPEPLAADDMEQDRGWIVDPDGTDQASAGVWVREDPFATAETRQPEDDHTPAPGTRCWVTGNSPANLGQPGADDVDDGCTTLLSPVFDLGGASGLVLRYWRWFEMATTFDDTFQVDVSNDGGSSWAPLERLTSPVKPFQEAVFPLDAVLGAAADRVALRLSACDQGSRSLIEALVDDLTIGEPGYACEPPDPRPRLALVASVVGDSIAQGGSGNGNGTLEPGERVRLAVDLENVGNATATSARGTATLVAAPPGVLVSDPTAEWPDVAANATERTGGTAPIHFELVVPAAAACDSSVALSIHVDYDGPSGTYALDAPLEIRIGRDVDTVRFEDDFEGASDRGWTHVELAGQDDWHREPANGYCPYDPPAAHSGTTVWANDIGGPRSDGQTWDGFYRPGVSNYLESPPIDCTGLSGTVLSFWRWLSVEGSEFDQATVVVDGQEVWRNPFQPSLVDDAWTYQELDISAIADGRPDVRVRFTLTSDGGLEYGGWNLDDVRVFARSHECVPSSCAATAPPPGLGAVLFATGRFDQNGAEFTWPSAALGADEHYALYRGARPDGLVVRVTPPGFTGTTFDDRTAPGPLYFYSLRLGNCAGLESGDSP